MHALGELAAQLLLRRHGQSLRAVLRTQARRVCFGDYAITTNATTKKSMGPRAGQFIALGGKRGPTGIVWMLNLCTNKVVTRY